MFARVGKRGPRYGEESEESEVEQRRRRGPMAATDVETPPENGGCRARPRDRICQTSRRSDL